MNLMAGNQGGTPKTEGDWPDGAASLDDIRANIDRLDDQIVALLCERHRFVTAAAQVQTIGCGGGGALAG